MTVESSHDNENEIVFEIMYLYQLINNKINDKLKVLLWDPIDLELNYPHMVFYVAGKVDGKDNNQRTSEGSHRLTWDDIVYWFQLLLFIWRHPVVLTLNSL